MMRGNYRARKLILLMALVSIIGAGFGCLTGDWCPAVASYADDPAAPAPPTNVVVMVAMDPLSAAVRAMHSPGAIRAEAPHVIAGTELSSMRTPSAFPANPIPQRC